jgi:hypothetical protein
MTMGAGRELDILIARHVMGYTAEVELKTMPAPSPQIAPNVFLTVARYKTVYQFPNGTELPYYSTDLVAAWHVVETVAAANRNTVTVGASGVTGDAFCSIWLGEAQRAARQIAMVTAEGEHAALAICRAALKAVGYEEPGP